MMATHAAGLPLSAQLNPLPQALEASFVASYTQMARNRAGQARVLTQSDPFRLRHAARLASTVPNVRLVLVKRNADDLVLRMMMHPRLATIIDEASVRRLIGWSGEMFDLLSQKLPSISLLTSYEEMLSNPGKLRSSIAEFCGSPARLAGPMPVLGDDRGCAAPYLRLMSGSAGAA